MNGEWTYSCHPIKMRSREFGRSVRLLGVANKTTESSFHMRVNLTFTTISRYKSEGQVFRVKLNCVNELVLDLKKKKNAKKERAKRTDCTINSRYSGIFVSVASQYIIRFQSRKSKSKMKAVAVVATVLNMNVLVI